MSAALGARLRAFGLGLRARAHRSLRRQPEAWALDATALVLCLSAAVIAWRKVHGLTWPCENDLYRDLGAAQSILDGGLGADPTYLGEHWWYQPLVPALVGVTSRLTGTPLHIGYTTLGVYLNLFAPIGLYALAVSLFGRRGALAALTGFLFLGPLDTMSWLSATYSPWLWSQNLAQAFFYFALFAWLSALRSPSPRGGVFAGVALGLTALAHTAPALLAAAVVVVTSGVELVRARRDRTRAVRVLTLAFGVAGVSAVVSAPFWLSVVVHYGAHVRNSVPLEWFAAELRLDAFHEEFWHLPHLRGALALVGVLGFFVPDAVAPRGRTLLVTWGAVAAAGIAYGYGVERFAFPALLPSWHFYFYLRALEALGFGLGVLVCMRGAAALLGKASRRLREKPEGADRLCLGVAAILLTLLCASRFRDYRLRRDLVENRGASQKLAKLASTDLYGWILDNTQPTDVFLANGEPSFYAVLPAGRKLVAMGELFSNPYVSFRPRARAEGAMFQALGAKHWNAFRERAREYRVRYVVLPVGARASYRHAPILRRVYSAPRSSAFDVYEVVALERN